MPPRDRAAYAATDYWAAKGGRTSALVTCPTGGAINVLFVRGRLQVLNDAPWDGDLPNERETFTVEWINHVRTVRYEQTTEKAHFMVELVSSGRVTVRRDRAEKANEPSLEYVQLPGKPVSFSLGEGDARKVFQAPTLWHLALAHPDECKQHLFLVLADFFPWCEILLSADKVDARSAQ